jgi:hypothetical protein
MQRHSSIRLTWVLAVVLASGWLAFAWAVPAQAHAHVAPVDQRPPQTTPTALPPTQASGGQPCLNVQVGGNASGCLSTGSPTLTISSLGQVTISGQNWMPGQGTLVVCPATINATCNDSIDQDTLTVSNAGSFTQVITNLSFASYTIMFSTIPKNATPQHVALTITLAQGVTLALGAALGAAVLSLLVFLVAGGLRVGARQPVSQRVQG